MSYQPKPGDRVLCTIRKSVLNPPVLRTGTIERLCGIMTDYVYVRLDKLPRERTFKTRMIAIEDCQPEDPT